MNTHRETLMLILGVVAVVAIVTSPVHSAAPGDAGQATAPGRAAQGAAPGGAAPATAPARAPRTIAPYFTPAASPPKAPDADGFLQRWLLLEPISKPNRTNTVFTDSYVRTALATEYFPGQFTVVPRNGDEVKVADQTLKWHALDSSGFNVKLFRFAYGLDKPTYGVLFWAVTVVTAPREMKDVRMAVGSNSASMWWLNGAEAVILSGDRRMVMDDCISKRLTLNKGRNVILGAVINGPGLSDFCVRFIDENGKPINELAQSLDKTGNQ
jgi:hypothetical protein